MSEIHEYRIDWEWQDIDKRVHDETEIMPAYTAADALVQLHAKFPGKSVLVNRIVPVPHVIAEDGTGRRGEVIKHG